MTNFRSGRDTSAAATDDLMQQEDVETNVEALSKDCELDQAENIGFEHPESSMDSSARYKNKSYDRN